jgi:hypothetical protein
MSNDKELEKCRQALDALPSSEREAVMSFARDHSRTPRLTAQKQDGKVAISNSHPDKMMGMLILAQALGTANLDFANGVIDEIIDVASFGRQMSENELNYVLSMIVGMRPQNHVQTLLAIEMVVNHRLLLENARLAANSTSLPERESAMQAHHKLSRNSGALAEVLDRLQSGRGQPVVHNVSVSDGSQAIVGNVTQVRSEQPPAAAPPVPDPDSQNRPRKRVPIKERARS